MLADAFFVHDKIDDVQAAPVGLAVSGKTLNCTGFLVDLHGRRFVVVKRAADPAVFVGLDVVVG